VYSTKGCTNYGTTHFCNILPAEEGGVVVVVVVFGGGSFRWW